eukprot:scaffold88166_cov96-Phaeocystis_antarctica.AAC.2
MQQRRTPRICGAFIGELHADRSRGPPPYRPLMLCRVLLIEKGNLSGETTFSLIGALQDCR